MSPEASKLSELIRKTAPVLLGPMALLGCSVDKGYDPNVVSECTGDVDRVEAVVDGPDHVNPEVILDYTVVNQYQDMSAGSFFATPDYIEDMGELVCIEDHEDGTESLLFLQHTEDILADYREEHRIDENGQPLEDAPEEVIERFRREQE